MNRPSRRSLIRTGLAAVTGATALSVANRLAERYGLLPPDNSGLYGPGETLTYAAQRLITGHSLARELPPSQISNPAFAYGRPPEGEAFERLRLTGFRDWRLQVSGMVARPMSFSIPELKSFSSYSHITQIVCEEGWSSVAQWTGVRLSRVLEAAGIRPRAKFVAYYSIQPNWWDSMDMEDALHPQTLVSYGMNGAELPIRNGGPLRMRVPRQLGYKSVKWITHMIVTDNLKTLGNGLGSGARERNYAWYAGL